MPFRYSNNALKRIHFLKNYLICGLKKTLLFFSLIFSSIHLLIAQKNYEDFAQKYTGMGALSEIIMSHKCIVRNNFNLFYESNVGRNELERTLVWYKLVFHQACKFSFNIIPNNESDRYELEVYKADVNFDICSDEIASGFSKQDSISKSITYTDSAQSATFRGSLFHTRDFEVGHDEAVYIIVNNLSGPDLGFVIDMQTCDYSYILKMNKEAISDQQKINRSEFETPFLRLKAISRKICNSADDKKLGYSSFLGESMKVKNFSARALDSASKQQAKAVRTLDSLAKRPLAAIPKKEKPESNVNTQRDTLIKKDQPELKNNSVDLNHKNSLAVSVDEEKKVLVKPDSNVIRNPQKLKSDSISVSILSNDTAKSVVINAVDSLSQKVNTIRTEKKETENKNDSIEPQTKITATTDFQEWHSVHDFYFTTLHPADSNSISSSTKRTTITTDFTLKDSLFNYFYETKNSTQEINAGENASIKSKKRRISSGKVFVQFVAVDAVTHKVLTRPDIKFFKGKSKRGFRIIHSDTIHGSRIEFQNAVNLTVQAKVFGYLPFEEVFDTINCYRFHDTLYDFLILQPLKKGDILDLPNVFFQPNTTVLKQSSYRELDKLVDYLNANNFRVRVNGHTQGNKRIVNKAPNLAPEYKFNGTAMRLSKKRADRVLNYLIEKGIDKKRISTKGYAGRKPKIKHPKTKSEREMNMRVEVEILK